MTRSADVRSNGLAWVCVSEELIKENASFGTRLNLMMVSGPNGRRQRYVPRIRRRRHGLQRGGVLPLLAMALSPWAVKKCQRRARRR